jgi:amino acid transporter
MLFCLVDAETVLATPTGMPIVELIFQATKSRAAATILSLMLSVCFINGTNASITSVSRLLYAMARDRGIVFHNYFSHIQSGLNVPVRTIMFCFVFNILFGLLYLGPVVAFSAYVASCTIFLNVSYAIPIIVLLIRGRKVLDHYQTAKTPFKLGKTFGLVVNIVGALYVVVTSVVSLRNTHLNIFRGRILTLSQFFCFPTFLPVTGNSMSKWLHPRS